MVSVLRRVGFRSHYPKKCVSLECFFIFAPYFVSPFCNKYKSLQIFASIWWPIWIVLPKPSSYEFLIWFKVLTSHDILQYLCASIHGIVFLKVSKCPKSLNLTNMVFRVVFLLISMCKHGTMDQKNKTLWLSKTILVLGGSNSLPPTN